MRYTLLATIFILITACSPKYEIKTHYYKPLSATGDSCLKKCESKRDQCQQNCDHKYDLCQERAEHSAKNNFPLMMREYDLDMRDYYQQSDRYSSEFNNWETRRDLLQSDYKNASKDCARIKSHGFKKGDKKIEKKKSSSCKKSSSIKKKLYQHTHQLRPTEPTQPTKPMLSDEISRLQENCSHKCGCTKAYDSCFVSCGGTLKYEKICVENCE